MNKCWFNPLRLSRTQPAPQKWHASHSLQLRDHFICLGPGQPAEALPRPIDSTAASAGCFLSFCNSPDQSPNLMKGCFSYLEVLASHSLHYSRQPSQQPDYSSSFNTFFNQWDMVSVCTDRRSLFQDPEPS